MDGSSSQSGLKEMRKGGEKEGQEKRRGRGRGRYSKKGKEGRKERKRGNERVEVF
jgi:hypothetical protein